MIDTVGTQTLEAEAEELVLRCRPLAELQAVHRCMLEDSEVTKSTRKICSTCFLAEALAA